jgi:adhesin transport system membrane fusion protein
MNLREAAKQFLSEDKDYIKDINAASLYGVSPMLRFLVWSVFLFLIFAITWANFATLDEVTRGDGKVIPSSQVQVIQNLEGGILSELLVKEGQKVEKGQALVKLSDIRFTSESQESKLKYYELLTQIARLTAEVEEKPLSFPAEITRNAPDMVKSAQQLYDTRQRTLQSTLDVLDQQYRQRQQEVSEMKTKRNQLSTSYDLVKQELDMSEPLVAQGAFSEIELLRLKRTANDIQGDLNAMVFSIPRLESAINEITQKKNQEKSNFVSEASKDLNEAKGEMERTLASLTKLEDRVQRTQVLSPVSGSVKKLNITTVGGVIQPGMDIMEIVPDEDSLLIEAKIRPKDIAFLHPGEKATIKFSAYDFSIYGGLEANLEYISSDTIEDEKERDKDKTYYLVRLRTLNNHLVHNGENLYIIPGMVAEVDILTGKKTVMDYLLKPILKAKETAMRER